MRVLLIDGGPRSGKSTSIRYVARKLRRLGYSVVEVPEAATRLLKHEGYPLPGRDVEWSPEWQRAFQVAVLARAFELEAEGHRRAARIGADIILVDRGVLTGAAYTEGGLPAYLTIHNLDLAACHNRYDMALHLESSVLHDPDCHYKEGNDIRYEKDVEECVRVEMATRAANDSHPNWVFVGGGGGIEAVKRAVLEAALALLSWEIERKFLVSGPTGRLGAGRHIRQAYFLDGSPEARMRLEEGKRPAIAMKHGKGIARQEWEPGHPVPTEMAEALWERLPHKLEKRRFTLPCAGTKDGRLHVDVYLGRLQRREFVIEAEFANRAQAAAFVLPARFRDRAREVTGQGEYANQSLAARGWPDLTIAG